MAENDNNRNNRGRRPNPDDKFEWKKAGRTVTFWILIFLASIVIAQAFHFGERGEVNIPYTEYRELLDDGKILSGYIVEKEFHGEYQENPADPSSEKIRFKTILPFVEEWMLQEWDEKGVDYEFREKATNLIGYFFTAIFPWLILIGLWIFFMRRLQGGGPKGVFSFGKSRAKLLTENKPKVTFADVAGADEAKEELQEIIEFLKDPKKFQRLGGRIPRGALLLGPPGTGKTLLARAVAGEAGVPFFSMSGADFVEMFVGVGASRVRDLFDQGKKNAPCIIFIDEIDAVGRQRGAGLGGGHDEREQTLNQLLVEMDGFESNEGVILLAATNRPDVLDPALMRPGRFDRQIVVDRPDVRGREGILKVHTKKIPLSEDVDLKVLAKGTPGLAGAELANLANEAALLAAKRNAERVTMEDLEEAKDKVMMGAERKSLLISDEEKKTTAYHEAGHVLVSKMVPGADPVHKVTIIPRGRALGLTHFLPIDEKHNYSKKYLDAVLTHLLGGRAAELLVFNEQTTGAGNDIERATEIARKMVCEWGMSEKLGPLTFGKKEEEIFLGREITQHRDYSEKTAVEIDEEVRRIVTEAAGRARKILEKHIDKLHALAEVLLEREILDGDEIDQILAGRTLKEKSPADKKKPSKEDLEAKAAREAEEEEDITPDGGEEPSPATA
jgi:cell division protease FtsH